MIPIIDLFAGPGGLGEGFVSLGQADGQPRFKIRLSIEKDPDARETLKLRAFFRQFPYRSAPEKYYDVLRQKTTREILYAEFAEAAAAADKEAMLATLGETPWSEVSSRLEAALGKKKEWVLIGGPPCQAYSLVGRSRNKGIEDYRPEEDEKHFLYKQYLQIIASYWPSVFVVENVKGLLSSRVSGESIFDRIRCDLTSPANAIRTPRGSRKHTYRLYSLGAQGLVGELEGKDFVLRSEEFGIPQARHRVIIIGIRDDLGDVRPSMLQPRPAVTVDQVIKHLPKLRSGISGSKNSIGADWIAFLKAAKDKRWIESARNRGGDQLSARLREELKKLGPFANDRGGEFVRCTPTIDYRPDWYLDSRVDGVCNHATRSHMSKDLYRYFYAACFSQELGRSPKLCDFPADLLPAHLNVNKAIESGSLFSDRFRVQMWNRPATTITSHISRDGHYYIHPDPNQCRSLTVREAARIQTFPDNYYFTGGRTSQYVQVGNAVPPLLAHSIAEKVFELLKASGIE